MPGGAVAAEHLSSATREFRTVCLIDVISFAKLGRLRVHCSAIELEGQVRDSLRDCEWLQQGVEQDGATRKSTASTPLLLKIHCLSRTQSATQSAQV